LHPAIVGTAAIGRVSPEPAVPSQNPDSIRPYTRLGLWAYDALVVNGFAPHFWHCPPEALHDAYRQHVTAHHADIGVGSGYFLDRADFGVTRPRLALIDLQPHCLRHTARRLARYQPETYLRDAMQPLVGIPGGFDSVALPGILHCLGGTLRTKARVFDALTPIVKPGTKLFGYTLVRDGLEGVHARLLSNLLNGLGVVDNTRDSVADLRAELEARYTDVHVDTIGCMALFSALVSEHHNAERTHR
jgi:hypothetical protein